MDFEASNDVCYTGLGLGLACYDKPEKQSKLLQQKKKKLAPLKYDFLFPPLSLGPPEMKANQLVATKIDADLQPAQQASSFSAVSSFSNSSSVKRERDFGGGEEVEGERLSNSRVSDEDEEGSPRKKLRLTKEQSAILEDNFKEHSTLNPKQKQALAEQLNLRPRQVEVWFQNRRARTKLKQTELDCELLKKCCETLTEENKRLHKDLQELKLKLASPVYMQLPAATLSMCPSCERICSGGEGTSTSAAFAVGPKTHFRNPFTHPSAAC